jgi:hypothetical protein
VVVAQPLLDDRLLIRAEAELPCASARIADCQYPYRVTFGVDPSFETTG